MLGLDIRTTGMRWIINIKFAHIIFVTIRLRGRLEQHLSIGKSCRYEKRVREKSDVAIDTVISMIALCGMMTQNCKCVVYIFWLKTITID